MIKRYFLTDFEIAILPRQGHCRYAFRGAKRKRCALALKAGLRRMTLSLPHTLNGSSTGAHRQGVI